MAKARSYGYTVENKLNSRVSQYWPYGETLYGNDPSGRRVMKLTNPDPNNYAGEDDLLWEFYLYTINGQRLVTINCNNANAQYQPNCWPVGENTYFGGRMLVSNGVYVVTDRLGTVRANTQGESFAYYPFGEERTSTVDGRDKFATYFRDTVGLDYAQQRYYNAGMGSFSTPDPGGIKTAVPSRPSSWNRYAYVEGDPVNFTDPRGLFMCADCGDGGGESGEDSGYAPPVWGDRPPPPAMSDSDQHGTGGGGSSLATRMRSFMQAAVGGLGPGCQRALGAVNLSVATPPGTLGGGQVNLLMALGQTDGVNFFDIGTQGQLTLSQTGIVDPSTGSAYSPDLTLAAAFGNQTTNSAVTINSSVLLGPAFWSSGVASQDMILVHEDLHLVFGGTTVGGSDVDVANYFNLSYNANLTGDDLVSAASRAISSWLLTDCGGRQ
jgi:RHS repeat-associated protein